MPATYTHTDYPTGTPLDQTIYNRAHQNHVTNFIAERISSEIANAAAMQTVVDPGEVGTEVTTTSIREDLRQLAAMIKEMRGTAQWYSGTGTVTMVVPFTASYEDNGAGGLGGGTFLPEIAAVEQGVVVFFTVPPDYRSGDITFTFGTNRSSAGAGNMRARYIIFGVGENKSLNAEVDTGATYTTDAMAVTVTSAVIALTGSRFLLVFARDSDHADDTHTAHIFVHSCKATYTGYLGYRGYR